MAYERYWVGMKSVQRSVGDSPCYECPDRHPGCRGDRSEDCKRGYAEWKEKLREAQKAYTAAGKPGRDVSSVRCRGKYAAIRESGRTVNETIKGGFVPGRNR